ncbi:MAG TPA: response regulator [Kofleriaceae bacterium]|nr:response regulator [Kofleriaceae bacterium]
MRVLVVEDDADGAEVLSDLVHSYGHDAAVASTGQAALDLDDSWSPDLILLDVALPDMSGHDVARALRARGRDRLRIIALSGHVRAEDVARSVEAGCDEHLPKPAPIAELERLLRARA